MSVYASLFKENNITGKRLLLLEDLKDRHLSKGHIIHLSTLRKEVCSILGLCIMHPVGGSHMLC